MKKTALLGMSEFGAMLLLAFLWRLWVRKAGKESICYSLSVSVQEKLCEKSHHCPFLAWTLGHGKKQQSHSDPGVLSKCCFCSCAGMHHVFICVQKSNVVIVCSTATAVNAFALFNVQQCDHCLSPFKQYKNSAKSSKGQMNMMESFWKYCGYS